MNEKQIFKKIQEQSKQYEEYNNFDREDLIDELIEEKRINEANLDLINKYKEVLDKIKEKGVMYYDPEYSKIYGELCSMPGANNTRTPVIVIDDEILELLEEIE